MTVHDFHECLAYSHKVADLPLWEEVYRKAFPGFQCMVDHRQDGDHQRAGVDRSVILASSKQVLVDEKARRFSLRKWKEYRDVLLEFVSNDRTGAQGWVCKPLQADYIAYAVPVAGVCFLMPVPQLQRAWEENSEEWLELYGTRPAVNPGYVTLSCPVPVKVLWPAIGKWLRISFTACEL